MPLPVLATPRVIAEAGPHGIIPLQVEGEQIAARIVGVVDRFPSVDGDVVVADRQTAATILDTRSPGLGTTDELWLNVPAADEAAAAATLSRAPFTQLSVRRGPTRSPAAGRSARARRAADARRHRGRRAAARARRARCWPSSATCATTAASCSTSRRRAPSPATIRAHLRLRALLVAAFGIVGGIALGAILASLVIALVSVTAGAAEPEPPLRLVLDLPLLAARGRRATSCSPRCSWLRRRRLRGRAPAARRRRRAT